MSSLDTNNFFQECAFITANDCRLLPPAWCPTRDVLVLVSRVDQKDKLELWKMQGAKLWEVDVAKRAKSDEITAICWSADGGTIAVAHYPLRLTLHSVHDGREITSVEFPSTSTSTAAQSKISSLWWIFPELTAPPTEPQFPDLLKRDGITPGSAHSILRILPLLDPVRTDTQKTSAARLFAPRETTSPSDSTQDTNFLSSLSHHPSLPTDLRVASIADPSKSANPNESKFKDEPENNTLDSLLIATDDEGTLYPFLDGTYALGAVSLGSPCSAVFVVKKPGDPTFYLHTTRASSTQIIPTSVAFPLLNQSSTRAVARVASTVQALLTYCLTTLKDMKTAWFGTDGREGARDIGAKWARILERTVGDHEGYQDTDAIFELTSLLFTGKLTEAVRDFFAGGQKLTDRALIQWENTVIRGLATLQESAERRIIPACERLVIMLEEVRGWASWPTNFGQFQLNVEEVDECLNGVHRAIELSGWLSRSALEEAEKFTEFAKWLRTEIGRTEELRPPIFDPLEVSDYIEHCLLQSSLDRWFEGPAPTATPSNLVSGGKPKQDKTLKQVLVEVRNLIRDKGTAEASPDESTSPEDPLVGLDRNLIALLYDISERSTRIFVRAAGAVTRDAKIKVPSTIGGVSRLTEGYFVKERIIADYTEKGRVSQFIAVGIPHSPVGGPSCLCFFHIQFQDWALETPISLSACIVECIAQDEREKDGITVSIATVGLELLDMDFFDDDVLICILRANEPNGPQNHADGRTYMTMLAFGECDGGLEYQELELAPTISLSREALAAELMDRVKRREFPLMSLVPSRSRQLVACAQGPASVAVNGLMNRRVACVLDGKGHHAEILSMGEEEAD